jgi:V/A-type H+-transporting ATPase subunit E
VPLEHILRAMQAHADAEIAQIHRAADEEIAQLIAEAEAQAQAIRARHHARVEPLLAQQAANLQNQAELDARRALAEAREQLLNEAFAQAQARLAQVRPSNDYPAIFRALVHQAINALGNDIATTSEQRLIVHVDPADVALARTVFNELGVSCEIVPQTMPLGGVEIATFDERVVITNTLAARLERARKYLRGTIAQMLVGDLESHQEWMTSTAMPTPA